MIHLKPANCLMARAKRTLDVFRLTAELHVNLLGVRSHRFFGGWHLTPASEMPHVFRMPFAEPGVRRCAPEVSIDGYA